MTENPSTLELICDRESILATLSAADAVVPTTSTKPILTNVLIQAQAGKIEVIATDAQVGLRATCTGVEVIAAGSVVVSARHLTMILKESASPSVTFKTTRTGDQQQLQIILSDGDFTIPTLVGETFPVVNFPAEGTPTISIEGSRLADMMRQTAFAMDKDRSSAVLSGMLLAIGSGEFVLCATDGKVLGEAVARSEVFQAFDGSDRVQTVMPAATVNHLQRIMGNDAQEVRFGFAGSNKLLFVRIIMKQALTVDLTSRLVEGAFPPYKAALPASTASSAVFATAELSSAVRRASMLISQANRTVVMEISGSKAVFTNLNYSSGNARIEIPCSYNGQATRIGINAGYMGEVLRVYRGERVAVEFARGMIIREPGATYLVMPITLPT